MSKYKYEKGHLIIERQEITFLLDYLGYNGEDIGFIINRDKSLVSRLLAVKPKGWVPRDYRLMDKIIKE